MGNVPLMSSAFGTTASVARNFPINKNNAAAAAPPNNSNNNDAKVSGAPVTNAQSRFGPNTNNSPVKSAPGNEEKKPDPAALNAAAASSSPNKNDSNADSSGNTNNRFGGRFGNNSNQQNNHQRNNRFNNNAGQHNRDRNNRDNNADESDQKVRSGPSSQGGGSQWSGPHSGPSGTANKDNQRRDMNRSRGGFSQVRKKSCSFRVLFLHLFMYFVCFV